MQEAQVLFLHNRYLIRKLLDAIPGTPDIIFQILRNLLQNPDAVINKAEDKNLQQIMYLLRNPETKVLTRETIEERLTLLKGPNLPLDVTSLILEYHQINELLVPMLISKSWYKVTLRRWQALLVSDFGVSPEIAQKLTHPNIVYSRISDALLHNSTDTTFIAQYGLDSFCFCVDVEDPEQFYTFFKSNTIPSFNHVALLGNLFLVKFYIQNYNRALYEAHGSATSSGSIPLLLYTIEEMGEQVKKISEVERSWKHLPKNHLVFRHWGTLEAHNLLSCTNLALTGSVAAFKRSPQLNSGGLNYLAFSNAIRSRSALLIQYLLEDPSFRFHADIVAEFKKDPTRYLNSAAAYGATSIVRYLIEIQKIKPDTTTMQGAIRSGSLRLVTYLLNHFKSTETTSPNVDLYLEQAIKSGSLRMVRFIRKINPNFSYFTKYDLNTAAEIGLLPVLCFILTSNKLLSPDQETLTTAVKSNFAAAFHYLVKITGLTPTPNDLVSCQYRQNLFTLRQVVESQDAVNHPVTTLDSPLAGHHINIRYLASLTSQKRSPTFWNNILSRPFENTIHSLTKAILFSPAGDLQTWFSTSKLSIRAFRGIYYANFYNPREIISLTTFFSGEDNFVKSVEVTYLMKEILAIIKDIGDIDKHTHLEGEKIYFKALREIQSKFEIGLYLKEDPPKALAFYQKWHDIVSKILSENGGKLNPESSPTFAVHN